LSPEPLDGVLVVDKPAGPTSHDVVARVRRAIGVERIGHTGTLDPFATGVLPLVVGRATRLARFLSAAEKEYDAVISLGHDTDTGDFTGQLVAAEPGPRAVAPTPVPPPAAAGREGRGEPAVPVDRPRILASLARLTGTYDQVPPAFSAKKVDGIRAYIRARRGQAVAPRPVTVTVHALELLDLDPVAATVRLRVVCSAGFYVRALARDLGRELQTGAHLLRLRRTRSGDFGSDRAVPLEVIEAEGTNAGRRLVPMDGLLGHLPVLVLSEEGIRRAVHGNDVGPAHLAGAPIGSRPVSAAPAFRLVTPAGGLVAVAEPAGTPGFLHPAVVVV
jgi:tRNA pseudouridine55 synthase